MDRFYAFKEKCALRQEARHVQKEAKMRERAVNAAAKGKKTKAAIFQAFANHHQNKAQYAHFKAENAHLKTSTTCMVIGPENGAKMQVYHHSNVPTTVQTGTGPAPEKMPMMPDQQQFFNTYMAGAFPFLQTKENPMQPPAYPPQAPAYQEKPPAYPSDEDLYPKEPTNQGYPGEAPPPYSGNPEKK